MTERRGYNICALVYLLVHILCVKKFLGKYVALKSVLNSFVFDVLIELMLNLTTLEINLCFFALDSSF